MDPILAADELAWSVDYGLESTRFIQALTIAQADHERLLEIGLARSSKLQKAMNL